MVAVNSALSQKVCLGLFYSCNIDSAFNIWKADITTVLYHLQWCHQQWKLKYCHQLRSIFYLKSNTQQLFGEMLVKNCRVSPINDIPDLYVTYLNYTKFKVTDILKFTNILENKKKFL